LATTQQESKFKQLALLSKQLDKAHTIEKDGRIVTNSLVRLGDRKVLRVPCISTGLPTFDYEVLQYGGIPRGRIIEVFGPESAGKTTLALHIAAQEQKNGGIVHFEDAEHKLEPMWAAKLGVNIDDLLFNQPNSGEEALDSIDKIVESECVSLIIVDSAASLVPEAELAGDIGDQHMGLQSRMLSQAMRILTGKCCRSQTTILFINQIREKIGTMFGNPETTPGGRALKFYSSVRLSVTRPQNEAIWEGTKENIVGHSIDLRCVKNGGGIPFRRTQIDLIYPGNGRSAGFDRVSDLITFANKRDMFEKSGTHFLVKGEKVANGLEAMKRYLKNNEEAFNVVSKAVELLVKKETESINV
jgi:recombination protein RecA